MKLSFDVEVRTYELDSYGHVNNAVYLNYFEYTRLKFLDAIGFDYNAFFDEGYMMYVTKVTVRYIKSIFLKDKIHIEVEPTKMGIASGAFHQTIKNKAGDVYAEAEISWGCVSRETGRPIKIPEKYRTLFVDKCLSGREQRE